MKGSLCPDLCFQFCAQFLEGPFFAQVFLSLWFVLCSRICASSFAVWVAKLLALRMFDFPVVLPILLFGLPALLFSVLPLLHFLDSRERESERVRVKEDAGGDRRRGERERGRAGDSREER